MKERNDPLVNGSEKDLLSKLSTFSNRTLLIHPYIQGYIDGMKDGASYKAYSENGLIIWPLQLEPPFIPCLDQSHRSGYRDGFMAGRLSWQ